MMTPARLHTPMSPYQTASSTSYPKKKNNKNIKHFTLCDLDSQKYLLGLF